MFRCAFHCCKKHQKFQSISPLRAYALASPRVLRPRNSNAKGNIPNKQNPAFSNAPSWPIDVLRAACQSGAVKTSLPKVHEFLGDIWGLAGTGSLNKSNAEALLSKNGLDAEDLTMVARCLIIQRSDKRIISLGLDCLSLAADIGDSAAALYLVDLAVENKAERSIGPARYQKALSHIKNLAAARDLSSMVLLAKLYEQTGNHRQASSIYQEVVGMEANHMQQGMPILEKERYSYAEAYRNLARLLSQIPGSEDLAFQYFERAALEYEDAMSFYYMALAKGNSYKDYTTWMSQAAISGITDATYELGLVYSKEGDREGFARKKTSRSYSTAIHWFELAKESVELAVRAKLHIARIQRIQDGPGIEALSELASASGQGDEVLNPSLQRFILAQWADPVFTLDVTTLENKIQDFGVSVAK